MILDSNSKQWQLFGFDVRDFGRHWQHAWADFLWGDRSPVRVRLDEVVMLHTESGTEYFHNGESVAAVGAECEAVLLPDSLVLFKTLRVPRAAEAELASVMALEAASNSPFPADDTGSGWVLGERDDNGVSVQLAIISLSATMRYLGKQYDIHDVHEREVWARSGARPIVLRGFGEGHRLARYKRRLVRIGGMMGLGLAIVLTMVVLSVGGKYLEMRQYQALTARVTAETRAASEQRAALSTANQIISGVDGVALKYPNPHFELARLTRLLGDDAYIAQFSMRGNEVRLRGRATDAAAVMAKLTSVPAFAEVTAEQGGITKLGNTGLEQFYVTIRLGDTLADSEAGA